MLANVTIAGVASSIPEKVVTNTELELLVETSDEWRFSYFEREGIT